MSAFVEALGRYAFLRYAVATGLLASIACGIVGAYVVTRRITYIAGAIAHCVLGGMGAARYLQLVCGWEHLHPLHGAVAAALIGAVIIAVVSVRAREREDTVIGAVWAVGMAIGILFIARTPGYNEDLMSYLFGNILMVSPGDLWIIAALDVVVLGVALLFYNQLQAVCFDDEFARLRGLRVELYYGMLLCLVALCVVLLVTVVGIIMVIALLTLPAAIASQFTRRLWKMMLAGAVITSVLTTAGLALSYGPDFPPGATIIVLAGASYMAVLLIKAAVRAARR